MRSYIFSFIFVLLVFTGSVQSQTLTDSPLIDVQKDGVLLHWQTPTLEWQQDDAGRLLPHLNGYDLSKQPGQYRLPFYSVLVALPPFSEPTIEVTAVSKTTLSVTQPLAIAPRPEGVLVDSSGQVVGGDYVFVESAEPQTIPAATIEEMGTVRGVRLAKVTFHPIRVVDSQTIELVGELRVAVDFGASFVTSATAVSTPNPLTDAVKGLVINPAQVTPSPQPAKAQMAQLNSQAVVIEVEETGLTAVTRTDLLNAGFSLSGVNPSKLHLSHDGVPVPFEWDGDGDSSFESNERIIFFANPDFSRWSDHDSYILSVESSNGPRITTTATSTGGLSSGQRFNTFVLEENKIYAPNCYCGDLPFGRDGDRWVWDDLRQPGRPEGSYSFELAGLDGSQSAEITTWMIGFTSVNGANPDHRVDVRINGSLLGNVQWDSRTAVSKTFTIPANVLQNNSTLSLTLPGLNGVAIDGIWFDAAAIRYPLSTASVGNRIIFEGVDGTRKYTTRFNNLTNIRVYDVTDGETPVKLTNLTTSSGQVTFGDVAGGVRQYALANENGLLSPTAVRLQKSLNTAGSSSADYVIISHPDFIPSLNRLINWRQGQGMDVVVEDVLAIYDQYGNGRAAPEAIQSFLDDAYDNWAPTYVLLVGDATTDPKQYLESSSGTWLLPFMAEVDPWIGEVPSDNRYVSVDGNDIIPDMIVGRLPVNSAAETKVVVDKIVNYEQSPAVGSWSRTATFVADNLDPAGDFVDHSETIIEQLSEEYIPRRIYYEPAEDEVTETVAQVQQRWNSGSGLLFYNGHSSTHQWGAERFFHLDDVSSLTNGSKLPMVVQLTCLTGSFQRADFETLDEALLRHENGGAVAVWGATGLGVATGHEVLVEGYLSSLFGGDGNVGTAVLAGKINVMLHAPSNDELVETFTLMGDPAFMLNMEFTNDMTFYLPYVTKR